MIKYIALYRRPDEPEDFDEKYFTSHLPLIEKTPGLLKWEVAKVRRTFVHGFLGESQPYLVAEMYFADEAALKVALTSPEWQAAGANLSEIGGLDLVAMFAAEVRA